MMQREVDDPLFPIWLVGDSNPRQWQNVLATPLDPRHPVRHNIWTPILDAIQDQVYREKRLRIETRSLSIRNAVDDPSLKPAGSAVDWHPALARQVGDLRGLLAQHRPRLLLCFGAFSFEFAQRALGQEPRHHFRYWTAKRLGEEFARRIARFDPAAINALPLLHRVVSGGKFIQSHDQFVGQRDANYFEFAGHRIASVLLEHARRLAVWVE